MRKEKTRRIIAFYLLISFIGEICSPSLALALTSGPAQPETSSFEPVGTSEMVDLFSGDFTYNIPLLDVEGYPVNISYNSNITNDQEASWVGLGWNINVGSITRNMRGIPDDFNGDEIKKETNLKPNRTFGVSVGAGKEITGFEFKGLKASKNLSFGINYNNYTGISFEMGLTMGLAAGKGSKNPLTSSLGFSSGANGLTISPRVGFSSRQSKAEDWTGKASIGTSFNSRSGLKQLTLEASVQEGTKTNTKGESFKGNSLDYSLPISFGRTTYVPQVNTPMKSVAVTLSFKLGQSAANVDRSNNFGGYFSQEKLAESETIRKSYGYLNLQDATGVDAMLDFNREKDGPFGGHTSTLPMAGLTYDMYNVSGQGVGGMFRAFRNDLGYVYDHASGSQSESYSLGAELDLGAIVKLGVDAAVTDVTTNSGKWNENNSAQDKLQFKTINTTPGFEPAFFKQAGEHNVDADPSLYANIRGEELVRFKLTRPSKFEHELKAQLETKDEDPNTTDLSSTNYRTKRQNRNQNFSYISRGEYATTAMSKYLAQKPLNDPNGLYDIYGGTCNSVKHHIGEITTVRTDGTRYVYGIASYNTKHKEVSFNVSTDVVYPFYKNTNYDAATGLVSYLPNVDNSKNNKRGLDNFFSATEMPPYAHSYLLTSVFSADYIDVTGDGPSQDDLGTYTNFTYKRTTNNSSLGTTGNYKWRVPFELNKANYNENLKALPYDDQGNYLYGEKEIRFLEKIETKNYVAIFETVPRRDGFGVLGENGGISATVNPMHLLKKISLYSKPDYDQNGVLATPIKEVNFIYNYSLCKGIPNNKTGYTAPYEISNDGGKLTLKKIYFTYGKSKKGKLSPYTFDYGDDPRGAPYPKQNPDYSLKDYDRWGSYKPAGLNPGGYHTTPFWSGNSTPGNRSNSDYPYSYQWHFMPGNSWYGADLNVIAWQLTTIQLPSGGVIKVSYEADDYAYVQDKKAMQMFVLSSIGQLKTSHPDYGGAGGQIHTMTNLDESRNFLFFKLKNPILKTTNQQNDEAIFRHNYLSGLENLYFRANMRVSNAANALTPDKFDDVSGYADVWSSGLSTVVNPANPNYYEYGYIQLKNVCMGDNQDGLVCNQANPISKATWQFARLHCQREALNFNSDPDPNLDPEDVIFGLVDVVANVAQTFVGVNRTLNISGIGKECAFARSWIRLNTPDGFKIGGGSRVKELRITDNWVGMTGGSAPANSSYGQTYEYTTKDLETGNIISSGVAQNEPSIGNDENPLKQPIAARDINKNTNLLAPDDYQYLEYPIGEMFYPGCSVGYSKVTVKNLTHSLVKRHATGKIVYEYYTAKDFPVIAEQSKLDPKRGKSLLGKLLKFDVKDYMTASQGFRVILNDMHGKLKSQFIYGEDKPEAISGTEYFYKTDGKNLLNNVTVINKDGTIGQRNVGVDYDFVADFRESETEIVTSGVQVNTYLFNAGPAPVFLPPIIPQFNRERVRFRSATVNKVINKYGLLDKVVTHDLGSQVSTEYLAYDAVTGEVLLTKTNTIFNDATYNLQYPAHFAYDGMGPAFENTGLFIDNVSTLVNSTTGMLQSAHPYYHFLNPGDLLMYYHQDVLQTAQYWVQKKGNDLYLINSSGAATGGFGTDDDFKVYRSGQRNMQTIPVGGITSFYNPLLNPQTNTSNGTLPQLDEHFGIIQSSALQFSDKWQTFCECGVSPGSQYNPYRIGTEGNWRKKKDYAYLSVRQQTKLDGNSNIRKDGVLKTFSPFWIPNGGDDWNVPIDLNSPNPQWTWVSEAVKYSTNGFGIEDRDALGRYSSAYLGYNYTLASAVVSNSKYRQSGFDGFEDYAFRACTDDHLGFKQHQANVVATKSHTGKKSIKVGPNSSVLVTKVLEVCP